MPNGLRHTTLEMTEIIDVLEFVKSNFHDRSDLTIEGRPADEDDLRLLSDGLTITMELLKRRKTQ